MQRRRNSGQLSCLPAASRLAAVAATASLDESANFSYRLQYSRLRYSKLSGPITPECDSHDSDRQIFEYNCRLSSQQCRRSGIVLCSSFVLYCHIISILACCAAAGLTVRDSATATDAVCTRPWMHNSILRHARASLYAKPDPMFCRVWTPHAVDDLCAVQPWPRLKLLREISLFAGDCPGETENVQLAQLFNLDWTLIKSEADMRSRVDHLQATARDCVLAAAGSGDCRRCFERMWQAIVAVDRAYANFNRTLYRFDCMPAIDTASATRPFSPNGSCAACKMWYRKWLLVSRLQLWKEQPCINWCYYAQLTCPHMGTSKVVDYAGHPSFQCKDLHIPPGIAASSSIRSSCNCFHPCDMQHDWRPGSPISSVSSPPEIFASFGHRTTNNYNNNNGEQYDFFPSVEHCRTRDRVCRRLREKQHAAEHPQATPRKSGSRHQTTTTPRTTRSPESKRDGRSRRMAIASGDSRSTTLPNSVSLLLLILLRWPPQL